MARNPKPLRVARKRLVMQTALSKRLINEVINDDWEYRSMMTTYKRKSWRRTWRVRLAEHKQRTRLAEYFKHNPVAME
jgi:hypothetical protein